MRTWIKLYTEILSDPKMGRLTDRQFRTCINLFAAAGLMDKDGALPSTSDIAWQLRRGEDEVMQDITALVQVGIVEQDGLTWRISKWQKRQAKPPSDAPEAIAERVREFRERERAKQAGNESVTPLPLEGNALEEKRREVEEEEKEKKASEYAIALRTYENEIGLLSGSIAEDMADIWDLLDANGITDWWTTAIAISVANNKRSWNYMRAILMNCMNEGRAPHLNGNGNGKSEKSRPKYRMVDDIDEDGKQVKKREYLTQ